MKNKQLHHFHARLQFSFSSGIHQNTINNMSKKRWLSLRRAVWPTTTTRSQAPFSRGAIRKSAVFFCYFRSLSRLLRGGSTKKEIKRLGNRALTKPPYHTFYIF